MYIKRVSKDIIEACKNKGLCLYYSNTSHYIQECTYLLPIRPEVKVFTARTDGTLGLNKSRTTGISTSRIYQIKEVLNELDSNDFNNNT